MFLIAGAPAFDPYVLGKGTVAPVIMLVSDLFEKMYLILSEEERGRDAVNRRVAPALLIGILRFGAAGR